MENPKRGFNDFPSSLGDLDLRLKDSSAKMGVMKNSTAISIGVSAVLFCCFGSGVILGSSDTKETPTVTPNATRDAPKPSPLPAVTVTVAVPTMPVACQAVLDYLMKMQDPLNEVIDSGQRQIDIADRAYVAIASGDSVKVSNILKEQRDQQRTISHASAETLTATDMIVQKIEECDSALGR